MPRKIDPDSLSARLVTIAIVGELANFAAFGAKKLQVDALSAIIIAFIAHRSFIHLFARHQEDPTLEHRDVETLQSDRHPVFMKDIYLSLGMSRETVRRKLLFLEEKNYLIKKSRGYLLPIQSGNSDYTISMRNYSVEMALRINDLVKKNILNDE